MHLALLALSLLGCSASYAQQDTGALYRMSIEQGAGLPAPGADCVPKKIDSISAANYPITDQTSTEMCGPLATAALVDAYRAKYGEDIRSNPTSPVALLAFKRYRKGNVFGTTGSSTGTVEDDLLAGIQGYGACSNTAVTNLPLGGNPLAKALEDWDNDKRAETTGYMGLIRNYLSDYDRKKNGAKRTAELVACATIDRLAWAHTQDNYRYLADLMTKALSSYDKTNHDNDDAEQQARFELFRNLVAGICSNWNGFEHHVPTQFESVSRNNDDPPLGARGIGAVNKSLNAGNPVVIRVDNRFWRPDECKKADDDRSLKGTLPGIDAQDHKTLHANCQDGGHFMIVTGRDFRNGKCMYRVRNSLGANCSAARYTDEQRKNCSGGELWVDSSNLDYGTTDYFYAKP